MAETPEQREQRAERFRRGTETGEDRMVFQRAMEEALEKREAERQKGGRS